MKYIHVLRGMKLENSVHKMKQVTKDHILCDSSIYQNRETYNENRFAVAWGEGVHAGVKSVTVTGCRFLLAVMQIRQMVV